MASKTQNPFLDFDFSKFADLKALGTPFKVPGVDTEAVLEMQRKNIEALTAANRVAFEGAQAIAERQVEILRQVMTNTVEATKSLTEANSPQDRMAKQAELVQGGYETACANVRELTEMNAKANAEAAELITKRVSESLDEVKKAFATAGK
jgi:phasin family protein